MAGVGAQTILIDTAVSRARASLFEVYTLYDATDALAGPLVLIPSRDALAELASQFGFATVALELNMTDFAGCRTTGVSAAWVPLLAGACPWRAWRRSRAHR